MDTVRASANGRSSNNLLTICGEGAGYVLYGKRPGHVDDGDNLHHDINLTIEWPAGQSPLRRI